MHSGRTQVSNSASICSPGLSVYAGAYFYVPNKKKKKMRSIHFTLAALALASLIAGCTVPKSVTSSVDMDYEKPMPPLELQKNQDDP